MTDLIGLNCMKYTIAQILILTAVIAIPLAMMLSSSDTATLRLMGLSQFAIATSLAAPFVCAVRTRPFWAGYAITTGYATFAIGSDQNAMLYVLMEPLQWLQSWLNEHGSQWAVANAISVWAAPLLGVGSGVILQLLVRLRPHDPNQDG